MVKERRDPLFPTRDRCLTYPLQCTGHTTPALRPGRLVLGQVPLGQPPSLHHLRSRNLVRRPLRYYWAVRLPIPVHHRLVSSDFPMRPPNPSRLKADMGPPGSRVGCFRTCSGSTTAQGLNGSRAVIWGTLCPRLPYCPVTIIPLLPIGHPPWRCWTWSLQRAALSLPLIILNSDKT